MHGFQKDRTPKLFSLEETKKRQLAPQMLLEVAGIDLIFLSVAQVAGALSFRMVDFTAVPSVFHRLSS